MAISKLLDNLFNKFLSENTKEKSERAILSIAIASFIIHLLIIYLVDFGLISMSTSSHGLQMSFPFEI